MAGEQEHLGTCDECGATIYPEHLEKHVAERREGKLLCPFCLRAQAEGAQQAGATATAGEPEAIVEGEGIAFDEPIHYDTKPTAIRSFGSTGSGGMTVGTPTGHDYRRPLRKDSNNATRCKTFHCKLADGPMMFLNEQINEWVDGDDDIEIKFATSTIGVVEGKHVDPHLIITIFY
jgi:hypothetical protein